MNRAAALGVIHEISELIKESLILNSTSLDNPSFLSFHSSKISLKEV
jgi:hypothetical protein